MKGGRGEEGRGRGERERKGRKEAGKVAWWRVGLGGWVGGWGGCISWIPPLRVRLPVHACLRTSCRHKCQL